MRANRLAARGAGAGAGTVVVLLAMAPAGRKGHVELAVLEDQADVSAEGGLHLRGRVALGFVAEVGDGLGLGLDAAAQVGGCVVEFPPDFGELHGGEELWFESPTLASRLLSHVCVRVGACVYLPGDGTLLSLSFGNSAFQSPCQLSILVCNLRPLSIPSIVSVMPSSGSSHGLSGTTWHMLYDSALRCALRASFVFKSLLHRGHPWMVNPRL